MQIKSACESGRAASVDVDGTPTIVEGLLVRAGGTRNYVVRCSLTECESHSPLGVYTTKDRRERCGSLIHHCLGES